MPCRVQTHASRVVKQGKGGGVEKRGINKEPLLSPLLNKNSIANKGGKERELEKLN
jgi:hypothetical protein